MGSAAFATSASKSRQMKKKWGHDIEPAAKDVWLGTMFGDQRMDIIDKELEKQKTGWARAWREKHAVGKKGLLTGQETGLVDDQKKNLLGV